MFKDSKKEMKSPISDKISQISPNIIIEGVVKYTDKVIVSGKVIGDVISKTESAGILELHQGGHIKGNVEGHTLFVDGKIEGEVKAVNITLHSNAFIVGKVKYKKIEIKEGAEINGEMEKVDKSMPSQNESFEPIVLANKTDIKVPNNSKHLKI